MKNKHILVVSNHYYPEQFRINDITKEWVKRGYKVTVVTGIPNYPEGKYHKGFGIFKNRKETINGVDVIRIPIIPRGNNPIMLMFNYLSYIISGWFWKTFTKVRADYVFVFSTSPMTTALTGVWYAKKHKVPSYIYVQDLWPENVIDITGLNNKFIIGLLDKVVDYIYNNSKIIFATSNSFVENIKSRGISGDKIKFWPQYAEDIYKPYEISNKSNDEVKIVFTGNIGEAQGLDILPKAIHKEFDLLKNKIHVTIVGDGRFKSDLIKIINDLDLDNLFTFIPNQPMEEIPKILAGNDVAFISLKESNIFEMTIPAKLQSYIACGMPILASASGEIKEIIDNAEIGYSSESGDVDNLAFNLLKLTKLTSFELNEMANRSISYSEEHFNKIELLKTMDEYFN